MNKAIHIIIYYIHLTFVFQSITYTPGYKLCKTEVEHFREDCVMKGVRRVHSLMHTISFKYKAFSTQIATILVECLFYSLILFLSLIQGLGRISGRAGLYGRVSSIRHEKTNSAQPYSFYLFKCYTVFIFNLLPRPFCKQFSWMIFDRI